MDVTVDLRRPLKYVQNEVILGSIFTALLQRSKLTCISTEHLLLLSVIQKYFAQTSLPDR